MSGRRKGDGNSKDRFEKVTWRYGDRCYICGSPATTTDHVIPFAEGGSNATINLRPCCEDCNTEKGGYPLEYLVLRMMRPSKFESLALHLKVQELRALLARTNQQVRDLKAEVERLRGSDG